MSILFNLSLGSGCITSSRICLLGSHTFALILFLFKQLRGYDWSLIKEVSVALAAVDNITKDVSGSR